VAVRVVLELPAPGVQDTGEPRQVGPRKRSAVANRLRAVADA
jgi:hypothetical protein